MLARAHTFAIDRLQTRRVLVEVDIRAGLPAFAVVGLADASVREARARVRAAIQNSDFTFPAKRITANLAPADLRKVGPGFDLALACAVLAASGQVPVAALDRFALFGELALRGDLSAGAESIAVALATRDSDLEGLVLPRGAERHAAHVAGIALAGVACLRETVALLAGERPSPRRRSPPPFRPAVGGGPRLEDVRGLAGAIEALTVAAAGAHNALLIGPPGGGKTMLARRLPSILPPLSREEAIDVTRVHVLAGEHRAPGLVRRRPFRAPHHHTSAAGLVGGREGRPGEVALADHGLLFLDELSEFSRDALEALRQPLEDGIVCVARGHSAVTYRTRFMLVAATNPCPCGYGENHPRCRCQPLEIIRYRRRLSGPLLDRIDMLIPVERVNPQELRCAPVTTSELARHRVCAVRKRQQGRLAAGAPAIALDARAEAILCRAQDSGLLTTRGYARVLRVARTVADLGGRERVNADDLTRAVAWRVGSLADPGQLREQAA